MIRRRHDKRENEEGHRPSEEMYEENCRRYAEQEGQRNRLAWLDTRRPQGEHGTLSRL